jgi:hypothetical protein
MFLIVYQDAVTEIDGVDECIGLVDHRSASQIGRNRFVAQNVRVLNSKQN